MTFSNINIGLSPNDGTGTVLRTAFEIVNDNFLEVEEFLVSQVTTSYLTATLSNYVTSNTFNSNNRIRMDNNRIIIYGNNSRILQTK